MLKRINTIAATMIKERALLQVASVYHDGSVSCRIVNNRVTNKRYFMQGQLVRDCDNGRFVSLSTVLKG